jgi:hypothetical protein
MMTSRLPGPPIPAGEIPSWLHQGDVGQSRSSPDFESAAEWTPLDDGPAVERTVPTGHQNGFGPREVRALQGDDAMATGMIGVILGIAFSVLLALTIGVTLWTISVSH